MDAAHPTLYELIPDSLGVFGSMTRGLSKERNLYSREKPFIWRHSHWFHDYERADRWASKALVEAAAAEEPLSLRRVSRDRLELPLHRRRLPRGDRSYRLLDGAVGAAARKLREPRHLRRDDDRDRLRPRPPPGGHPLRPGRALGGRYGIKTAYHSACLPPLDRRGRVRIGNGMAHVYLRGEDGSGPRARPVTRSNAATRASRNRLEEQAVVSWSRGA